MSHLEGMEVAERNEVEVLSPLRFKIVVSSSKPRRLVSISREMWFVPGQGEEDKPHEIESTRIHTPEVFRP